MSRGERTSGREEALLLACARVGPRDASIRRIASLLSGSLDWERVVLLARSRGLAPWLIRCLDPLPPSEVPEVARSQLHAEAAGIARRNLLWTGELLRLLHRLQKAGVAALPWKGPALAVRAYGDVGLRSFADLDVLVRRRDARRALELLAAEGYRSPLAPLDTLLGCWNACLERQGELALGNPRNGIVVDLHWALVPRFFSLPLEVDQLWERRRSLAIFGMTVPDLSPTDSLLTLCIHGGKHRWARLAWLLDTAKLLEASPDLDWPQVISRARALGVERLLRLGLFLAHELLDAPVPAQWLGSAKSDRTVVFLAGRTAKRFRDGGDAIPSAVAYHLRVRERWRDRIRYVVGQFPPTWGDVRWLPLPEPLWPLYFLLRPLRLAFKHVLLRRQDAVHKKHDEAVDQEPVRRTRGTTLSSSSAAWSIADAPTEK